MIYRRFHVPVSSVCSFRRIFSRFLFGIEFEIKSIPYQNGRSRCAATRAPVPLFCGIDLLKNSIPGQTVAALRIGYYGIDSIDFFQVIYIQTMKAAYHYHSRYFPMSDMHVRFSYIGFRKNRILSIPGLQTVAALRKTRYIPFIGILYRFCPVRFRTA